jgi:hypothetical protein
VGGEGLGLGRRQHLRQRRVGGGDGLRVGHSTPTSRW